MEISRNSLFTPRHTADTHLLTNRQRRTGNRKTKFSFRMWMMKSTHNLRNCFRHDTMRPQIQQFPICCVKIGDFPKQSNVFYSLLFEFIYFQWASMKKNDRQKLNFTLQSKKHNTFNRTAHKVRVESTLFARQSH